MAKRNLTAVGIARIKAPAKGQVDHFDKGYPALALRVSYGGGRTWIYYNRFDGKLHRTPLGTYPAMSLGEAREAWREARKKVERGEDPTPPKFTPDDATRGTVRAAAEEFIKRHVPTLRPRTQDEYRRPVEKLVIPRWGHRAVADIRRSDVLTLIDDVTERSGPIAGNRAFSVIRRFFTWMIERGLVEATPCANMRRPNNETSRDRVLSDHEIAALWTATAGLGFPFDAFFRVLTLTGQRRAEVAGMKWADLDLQSDKAIWTLAKESTKAAREHTVPLAPQVIAILKGLPKPPRPLGDFVFSTTSGEAAVSGFSRARRRIDALLLKTKQAMLAWSPHDLRRTAASNMARMGLAPHVVAAVLNHSPGSTMGVTSVYNRYRYGDEKRAALEAWAAHIDRLTGAASTDNVIVMPKRAAGAE